jgi:tripartite-type tricarboxylate transporter receptor subunit TctC
MKLGGGSRFAALLLAVVSAAAQAQPAYPSKPLRIIVPFPAGGSNDILSRMIGKKLTDRLGVPVIVDNRGGANTILGASALAKSPPDGYTLMVTSGSHIITPLLMATPYDALADFAAVAAIDAIDYLMVVHPSLPAHTLKEFIALAKARPGQINYASSSQGSGTHLAAAALALRTGIRIQHVPYKGGGPAVIDLMAGQVQMFLNAPIGMMPYVKSGRLRALAVTGERRLAALPEVPTFTEAGLPDFDVRGWHGMLAPAATPRDIVAKLNAEVGAILAMPDTIDTLAGLGMAPLILTPEQFAARMRADTRRYAGVIKAGKITAD